ncbi:MAG: hypothetical protein BGO05_20805 [Rhizobiales bacterium 63-7]|nr:DUF1376 domain-containing protein [Hyphomicrobiales bacterium]OJU65959.1 MAG: hypothetical protein BGO05_20805 [Rhizobiales bacterium 63-7]
MADFPALSLWTDAYIADTQHLTNEEHGVYLRLLMFAWRSKECGLPDDDRRLALMVGVGAKKWAALKPVVMSFWTLKGGLWTQKRLTAERDFVERRCEQKRAAGFASSKAKALKRNNVTPTAVAEPLVTEVPTDRQQPIPTPIPIYIEGDKSPSHTRKQGLRNSAKSADPDPIEIEFQEAFWPIYPRKVDKADALKAFKRARKETSLETIMACLQSYKRKMDGTDLQFIRHASKFLNAKPWNDDGNGALPGPKPADAARWKTRLSMAREKRQWSASEWGPPPGAAGCLVPADLLQPGDGHGWGEYGAAA